MWALKAFVLGSLALGVVGYAVAAALAVAAQAGGTTLDVAVGPLRFVSVTLGGDDHGDDVRPGHRSLLALAGGLANLAAAQLIRRRAGRAGRSRRLRTPWSGRSSSCC